MTNHQDRHAFKSFNSILQDLYNRGCKNKFYAKGYRDGEDDGTAAINTFTGGKTLDWLTIDGCKTASSAITRTVLQIK